MVILNSQRIRCWLCWLPIGAQRSYAAVQKAGGVGQCSLLGERPSLLIRPNAKFLGQEASFGRSRDIVLPGVPTSSPEEATPRSASLKTMLLIFVNWRNERRGIASERATGLSSTAWGPTSMWQQQNILPSSLARRQARTGVDHLGGTPGGVAGGVPRAAVDA